jgi:hypothetical protein
MSEFLQGAPAASELSRRSVITIHIRVKSSHPTFTTEVYFHAPIDETLRAQDRVFQGRGPNKGEMVVRLDPASRFAARLKGTPEPAALACAYDLTLT